MSDKFKKLYNALFDDNERIPEYPKDEGVLSIAFGDVNGRVRDNPYFENTESCLLQTYISLMEIIANNKNGHLDDELIEYSKELIGTFNPMNFLRFYHPDTSQLFWCRRTPAFIEPGIESYGSIRSKLNDNDMILRCIDDHVKYQWKYLRTHLNDSDDSSRYYMLPHLYYLIITDNSDTVHLIRLKEKSATL